MAKIDDSVKKKVPELRFPGFTDDWEERKLKDIAQFNPKTVLPDEFEYVDLESVVGTEMISHRTEFKDQAPSRAQRLAQKGDVFYQTVRPYQMNNYLYDLPYDNYVFSTGYAQMRPNIDSYFLLNSVQNKQFVQHVLDRSTGTSYPAINSSDLSNIEIHVPSKLSEQQKIGAFFQSIDDTIALHQRKLDLLKEQKKGYLQKMFPKNGAKVPELRFAGFADDWEERNLGEWSDVRDGTHASPKYIKQGHPMVTSKNLTDSGLDMSDVSYLTDEDFNEINQRSKVDIGDILFGMIGTIGKPVIVDRDDFAIKNVALIKEKTSPEIINTWLIQYLKSPSFERFIQKENAGGTQKFIALGLIRDMKLMTPSVQEQARIGELLNHLDNLIVANQRKLDLLKEQKKGYLQKMFA